MIDRLLLVLLRLRRRSVRYFDLINLILKVIGRATPLGCCSCF